MGVLSSARLHGAVRIRAAGLLSVIWHGMSDCDRHMDCLPVCQLSDFLSPFPCRCPLQIAYMAFILQAQATGKGPLAALSAHLSNPFGNNILKVRCFCYSNFLAGRNPSSCIPKLFEAFTRKSIPGLVGEGAKKKCGLPCAVVSHAPASPAEHRHLHRAPLRGCPGPDHPPDLPVARQPVSRFPRAACAAASGSRRCPQQRWRPRRRHTRALGVLLHSACRLAARAWAWC